MRNIDGVTPSADAKHRVAKRSPLGEFVFPTDARRWL